MTTPIDCSVCGKTCENIFDADRAGWDWFQCYLPERFVACSACQIGNVALVEKMRRESQVPRELPPVRGQPEWLKKKGLIILP